MSLTNPNKVITEERLSEFYQGILPYLGGMPDILANKFSKADLYSTDETMIGRWIDGKPLYQKTFNTGALPNNERKQIVTGLSNITFREIKGICRTDSGWTEVMPMVTDTDNICVNIGSTNGYDLSIRTYTDMTEYTSSFITAKYTKNADSPVEIGNDTDYSTTEKIVGTWIDGKPLYQKTVKFTTTSIGTSWTTVCNLGVTNVNCIKIDYVLVHSAGKEMYGNIAQIVYIVDTGAIQAKSLNGAALSISKDSTVTIQYTKTTD